MSRSVEPRRQPRGPQILTTVVKAGPLAILFSKVTTFRMQILELNGGVTRPTAFSGAHCVSRPGSRASMSRCKYSPETNPAVAGKVADACSNSAQALHSPGEACRTRGVLPSCTVDLGKRPRGTCPTPGLAGADPRSQRFLPRAGQGEGFRRLDHRAAQWPWLLETLAWRCVGVGEDFDPSGG